jgi:signal peptidase I
LSDVPSDLHVLSRRRWGRHLLEGHRSVNRPRRRIVIEWGVILIVAVLASFLVRTYAIQTFFIPSGSMEPTLHVGDRILVNKLSVRFGTINVGDIIVFKAPPTEHCHDGSYSDLVKRVIGLPGQTITSQGNTVFVNGKALKEHWTYWPALNPPIKKITVKANNYYVMGDYRSNSCDSRFWGTVPRSDIIGKAFFRMWPPSRIGFL